jgi:peptidoglycan L-alanyl-D-glutamate endopeptidase CwlK
MSRKLEDLSDRMRPLAVELLRLARLEFPVAIIETLRTPEQQAINVKNGVSWTLHSKHLTGDAIDVAPSAVLLLKNWAPLHPDWLRLGEIGEALGLVWGGRWKRRDCPHFQIKEESHA